MDLTTLSLPNSIKIKASIFGAPKKCSTLVPVVREGHLEIVTLISRDRYDSCQRIFASPRREGRCVIAMFLMSGLMRGPRDVFAHGRHLTWQSDRGLACHHTIYTFRGGHNLDSIYSALPKMLWKPWPPSASAPSLNLLYSMQKQ